MANPLSDYGVSDRDYAIAIGTAMGEAYRDADIPGYAAVMDTMANRLGEAARYGARQDPTIAGVGLAQWAGAAWPEYNAWSPRAQGAYNTAIQAQRAALDPDYASRLSPAFQQELQKAQTAALGVFGLGTLRGITQGATFYNNPVATSAARQAEHRGYSPNGQVQIGSHVFGGRLGSDPFDVNAGLINTMAGIPDVPEDLTGAFPATDPSSYIQSYFDHEPPGGLYGFEGFDPNWGGIPQAELPGGIYGLGPDNLGVPMADVPGALYGLDAPQAAYGMPTDWGVGMNFGSPTFDMSYAPQQSPQFNMGIPDVPAPLNVGDFGGSNIDWGGLLQGATLDGWNPDFSNYAEDLGIGNIEAPGPLVGLDPPSVSLGYAPGVGTSRATSVMDMPSTIFGSAWAGMPGLATMAAATPQIAGVTPGLTAPASRAPTPTPNVQQRAPLNYAPIQQPVRDIPQQAPPMDITPQFAGVPAGFDPSWGVTGLAPSVMDQLGAAGVGAPTGGYSYGYSPFGDYSMVHASAPEHVQIAASGPGIFGALGSMFSGSQSQGSGNDYGGDFGTQFGGGWSSGSLSDSIQSGDYGGWGGGDSGGSDSGSSGGYGGGDYGGGSDPAGNNGN